MGDVDERHLAVRDQDPVDQRLVILIDTAMTGQTRDMQIARLHILQPEPTGDVEQHLSVAGEEIEPVMALGARVIDHPMHERQQQGRGVDGSQARAVGVERQTALAQNARRDLPAEVVLVGAEGFVGREMTGIEQRHLTALLARTADVADRVVADVPDLGERHALDLGHMLEQPTRSLVELDLR